MPDRQPSPPIRWCTVATDEPQWGLVVVDLPGGESRAYGRIEDPDALARLEAEELVGAEVTLEPDGNVNRVRL